MQRSAGVPAVVSQIVQGTVILLSLGFAFARERGGRPSAPSQRDGAAVA